MPLAYCIGDHGTGDDGTGDADTPELLGALGRYGLVRTTATTLRLHRLVQDIARWALDAEGEAACVKWASHLDTIAPDPEEHRKRTIPDIARGHA